MQKTLKMPQFLRWWIIDFKLALLNHAYSLLTLWTSCLRLHFAGVVGTEPEPSYYYFNCDKTLKLHEGTEEAHFTWRETVRSPAQSPGRVLVSAAPETSGQYWWRHRCYRTCRSRANMGCRNSISVWAHLVNISMNRKQEVTGHSFSFSFLTLFFYEVDLQLYYALYQF